MRRRWRRSTASAFGLGLFWATVGTATIVGLHFAFAPPGPDQAAAEQEGATVARLARWTRQVLAAAPEDHAAATTERELASQRDVTPAPVAPAPVTELTIAQPRIARVQADADAHRVLTRSIQQELRRVGCYQGAIDGNWSDSTRGAMMAFNDRLNAKLPSSAPDYILLTMLQGHSGNACSGAPQGGVQSAARPSEKLKAPLRSANAGAQPAAPQSAPAQRSTPPSDRTARESAPESWSTSVISVPAASGRATEPRATATSGEPGAPGVKAAAVSPSPTGSRPAGTEAAMYAPQAVAAPPPALPGRMAIGAPIDREVSPPQFSETGRVSTALAPLPLEAVPQSPPVSQPAIQPQPRPRVVRQQRDGGESGGRRSGGGSDRPRTPNVFARTNNHSP